jgi:threonine 3-dehydrogenase
MTNKMRALVKKEATKGLNLEYVDMPKVGPNDILVKVEAASICGSDIPIYYWNKWAPSRIIPPTIIGHEFAGKVVEVGEKVKGFNVGEKVSAESHITCGKCYQCLTNQKYACQNTLLRGIDFDGCFAEYHVVRESEAWKSNNIPSEVATLQEPFGNSIHAVTSCDVAGKTVVVFGCGPIGLFAIMLSKALGAREVIGVEKVRYRLDLARELGCDKVILADENTVKKIMSITDGVGADIVFEMSGAKQALLQGLEVVRAGGNVVVIGLYGTKVDIDISELVVIKGVTIKGIIGRRIWEDWFTGKALIECGKVNLRKVITHEFKLEEYEEAFKTVSSGQCGKVLFKLT